MLRLVKISGKTLIFIFAIIGFVLCAGYVAVKLKLTNTKGIVDLQSDEFLQRRLAGATTYGSFPLSHKEEWVSFRQSVMKDKTVIDKVSKETGVPSRVLVSILVPEQMRLFYTDRAIFKQVFEPLKMLGSQSQFSWGIFGIKDETARAVEVHLVDTASPFYLGKPFEKALSFKTTDPDQERFSRIVDEHDHYYGYLYAALFVKQVEAQWLKAGYKISDKPEIIATLWNLGFTKSKPNKDPKSGGALIPLDGTDYSFGGLAGSFYYSDEMIEIFPVEILK